LTPQEEAALFSLANLGQVDLTPKQVTVEVYVAPETELADCRRMLAQVWQQVERFYARLGVRLLYAPGRPNPGPLAPASYLRLELLTDKQWLNKSFVAFDVAPPFRLRFLQVCRDKCAFAHLPLSTLHVSFKRFQDAEFSNDPGETRLQQSWLANLLIHELGHLMGLYHAHEFANDPIPVFQPPDKTPNFMSHHIATRPNLGWTEWQVALMHSYLGGGKVFQQYQAVNFDPLRYLELVKRHNNYREPLPKVAKMAQRLKKGQPRTFDGEDEDDDDEDPAR
jgi:hypothetical protein